MSVFSGPRLVSMARAVCDAVADGACELGQTNRKLAGRGDDLTVAKREGGAPLLAPRVDFVLIVRPRQVFGQFLSDGVEM